MFTIRNFTILPFIVFLCLISQYSYAQIPQNPNQIIEGKKNGKWTILYDENWAVIQDTNKTKYFRVITYQADKPIGKVRDYYRNGKVQMEADSLMKDNPEVFEGLITYYTEKGVIREYQFYQGGKLHYEKTENYLKKLLDVNDQKTGKLNANYFNALNSVIKFYLDNGDYLKAEELQKESIYIIDKMFGRKHPAYATTLYNLALNYRSTGNFAQAEDIYQKVLSIRKETLGEKNPAYATVLNDLGALYSAMGNINRAEPLFRQALAIRKEVLGEKHIMYATSLNDMADLYYKIGNYQQAENLYQNAAKIYAESLGKNHEYYATALNNLANLYEAMERYPESIPLLQQANAIYQQQLGERNPKYATGLNNLAHAYLMLGRCSLAEPIFNQAMQIRLTVLGESHPDYANSLHNLGLLHTLKGNYGEAEKYYLKALAIRKKVLGDNHPDYSHTLRYLAKLYMTNNQYNKAEPLYREANMTLLKQKETYFSVLSEKEKEEFYNHKIRLHFEEYNSFVLQHHLNSPNILREMYNNQLSTKAVLLNDSNKWKELIMRSKDTLILTKFEQWRNVKSFLSKIQSEQNTVKQNFKLDSLEQMANSLEKDLSQKSTYFAKMTENKRFTWQDIQKNLKNGEAAIEIIRFRMFGKQRNIIDSSANNLASYAKYGLTDSVAYVALIITPQTKSRPEIVVIKGGNDLEIKYLNYYRNHVRFKTPDKLSYDNYWHPIIKNKALKGISKIFFSPDGVYNQLNMNTLQNIRTKKYLIEEINLSIVTNTKDLLLAGEEANKNSSALFVGSPNYDLGSLERERKVDPVRSSQRSYYERSVERSVERGSVERSVERGDTTKPNGSVERKATTLAYLPGTKVEVEQVSKLFQEKGLQTQVLMDDEALEENLKDVYNPRILHIATHGFFDNNVKYEEGKNVTSNPLLRSGLMLTGSATTLNNDAQGLSDIFIEDGILTAFEAMNLHLDKTDLVVLSACETGLGEIKNGEGVYGLYRAFKVAGAKTVIMSLWKVNDDATQELMYLFYKNWLSGKDKTSAFKNAQIGLKEKYPEPYYWGAFVLVGND